MTGPAHYNLLATTCPRSSVETNVRLKYTRCTQHGKDFQQWCDCDVNTPASLEAGGATHTEGIVIKPELDALLA